ncbi:MAG TPA: cytochrome c3 family protein [Bryobacteraceae bacterium]|nr:cytochrome c3 family protein [Bryobacteraceae bacterium]
MARLVQGLIAAACTASGLAGAPFSHRTHLKLKPDCLACHPSAAASTRLEENNLPARKSCTPCHRDGVRIKLPRAVELSRFNHAVHVRLGAAVAAALIRALEEKTYLGTPGELRAQLEGANVCTACHRGLADSDRVTAEAFPHMADCLVCHSRIEPPFSCEYCHGPGRDLRPATHTPDFLDSHASGKMQLDKQSCAVCHGRRFRCLGCH